MSFWEISFSKSVLLFCQKQLIKTVLEDHFKDDTEEVLREPVLFGDYRTALDEGEPRLYEDIQDYDACKALFQEVQKEVVVII